MGNLLFCFFFLTKYKNTKEAVIYEKRTVIAQASKVELEKLKKIYFLRWTTGLLRMHKPNKDTLERKKMLNEIEIVREKNSRFML